MQPVNFATSDLIIPLEHDVMSSDMSDLMDRGLELATFGMGTVFVFLTLLVVVTMVMSRIILAFDVESVDQGPEPVGSRDQHRRLVAVITAAVQRYRAENE